MPTDTERREVARRLREAKAECEERGYPWMCDDLILALGYDHDYEAGDEIFDLLADLIEPNRGSGGRTILCAHCENVSWCGCEPGDEEGGCDFEPSITEGEPPYNLYSLYEAVSRRRPRDKYAIDDDEVDELVDALLDICNSPGHERIQRPQPSASATLRPSQRDALLALADDMQGRADEYEADQHGSVFWKCEMRKYASRIREALGVSDG